MLFLLVRSTIFSVVRVFCERIFFVEREVSAHKWGKFRVDLKGLERRGG